MNDQTNNVLSNKLQTLYHTLNNIFPLLKILTLYTGSIRSGIFMCHFNNNFKNNSVNANEN